MVTGTQQQFFLLRDNQFNNNNNNNLNFHADVFLSAMRLHWKEGYIPPFWGGVLLKQGYTPIPAVPPYLVRTLHMRGAQSTEAANNYRPYPIANT